MARKAKLTPRERKTMEIVGGTKASKEAVFALEEMMDFASEVQDLLYFKSLDNKAVSNADLKVAYTRFLESLQPVDELVRETTKTKSSKYKITIEV